jgi:hypothetical protein
VQALGKGPSLQCAARRSGHFQPKNGRHLPPVTEINSGGWNRKCKTQNYLGKTKAPYFGTLEWARRFFGSDPKAEENKGEAGGMGSHQAKSFFQFFVGSNKEKR